MTCKSDTDDTRNRGKRYKTKSATKGRFGGPNNDKNRKLYHCTYRTILY